MRVLELFSGTGSVGNVGRRLGCDVISLDWDLPEDIRMDILDWNYASSVTVFHVIWASPPCAGYSVAKTVSVRKLDDATAIVQWTLKDIGVLHPTLLDHGEPTDGPRQATVIHGGPALQRPGLLQVWHAMQEANQAMEQRCGLDPEAPR